MKTIERDNARWVLAGLASLIAHAALFYAWTIAASGARAKADGRAREMENGITSHRAPIPVQFVQPFGGARARSEASAAGANSDRRSIRSARATSAQARREASGRAAEPRTAASNPNRLASEAGASPGPLAQAEPGSGRSERSDMGEANSQPAVSWGFDSETTSTGGSMEGNGPAGLESADAKSGVRSKLGELHQRLSDSARRCYPPAAARLGLRGEVQLHFCLSRDGAALVADLWGSTGSSLLDRAARECVLAGALPVSGIPGCYEVPILFAGPQPDGQ
jgi:TonB family protein